MNLSAISFAGKTAYNIKSEEFKKYVLNRLESRYGLRIIAKHFEKFTNEMDNIPRMLSVRSNGNPYFMYLMKYNFVNYVCCIDKKIQQGYCFPRMIIVNYHFAEELFTDTVFDTEMIKMNDGRWLLLINDLIVYKAAYLRDMNLIKRLNIAYTLFETSYMYDDLDISIIAVKKYFKTSDEILEHIPKLPYTVRGIYAKALFLKFRDILVNFDDTKIKKVEKVSYKHFKDFLTLEDIQEVKQAPQENNTDAHSDEYTEFHTKKTNHPDTYELYDGSGLLVGTACISSMKVSKFMRNLFETKNIVDKILIKYIFSQKFNKWMPVC
jgi:hypothetical protein